MTLLPQEVVMGNLQDVAETATAGVAAACAICAAAAAATAAVKMPLRYASMNAKCCMLNVIVCLIQWIMYIVVNLFKRPQKIGIHNICYWCGQRSKQSVCVCIAPVSVVTACVTLTGLFACKHSFQLTVGCH